MNQAFCQFTDHLADRLKKRDQRWYQAVLFVQEALKTWWSSWCSTDHAVDVLPSDEDLVELHDTLEAIVRDAIPLKALWSCTTYAQPHSNEDEDDDGSTAPATRSFATELLLNRSTK